MITPDDFSSGKTVLDLLVKLYNEEFSGFADIVLSSNSGVEFEVVLAFIRGLIVAVTLYTSRGVFKGNEAVNMLFYLANSLDGGAVWVDLTQLSIDEVVNELVDFKDEITSQPISPYDLHS